MAYVSGELRSSSEAGPCEGGEKRRELGLDPCTRRRETGGDEMSSLSTPLGGGEVMSDVWIACPGGAGGGGGGGNGGGRVMEFFLSSIVFQDCSRDGVRLS